MRPTTVTRTYRNPLASDGDFADPFVIRFNGRYYLYCTNPDIRCWSSSDLVSWQLEGPTIAPDAFPGLVPFAPEVIYSNGWFYMYTSPSGHGHFVLRSASPTGPFDVISQNVGHSIDGNVLIDDDGRWYFYWAGDEGIWACEMPTPTTFGDPVFTGAQMNGWTEGPFVFRRDGRYHMTLTGNHYLNAGYRINAAVSTHPLTGFVDDPLNPVLLSVGGAVTGVGHSSSVVGPDLVSTYLVYHNLNPDETRDLNIDRQVANGAAVHVLGPSSVAVMPTGPDACTHWSAGNEDWVGVRADGEWADLTDVTATWLTTRADEAFTAEVTLVGRRSGAYGVEIAGGADGVRIDIDGGRIILLENGDEVAHASLPADFVHDVAHTLTLSHDGERLRVSIDGRSQFDCVVATPSDWRMIVHGGPGVRVGYCAVTASVASVSERVASKPVPGRFWAALTEGGVRESTPGPVSYDVVLLTAGQSVSYDLEVAEAGEYAILLTGGFEGAALVAESDGDRANFDVSVGVAVARMALDEGAQRVRLTVAAGSCSLALVTIVPATEAPDEYSFRDPIVVEGFDKALVAEGAWGDFVVEADIEVSSREPGARGGLILRASELSNGGSGSDDACLGNDFFLGYSLELAGADVLLNRHDYDSRTLARARVSSVGPLRVRVAVVGERFEVEVGGEVVISHADALPHLTGGVGIRASGSSVTVRDLTVRPI